MFLRVRLSWKHKLEIPNKKDFFFFFFLYYCWFENEIYAPLKTVIHSHMKWTLLKVVAHISQRRTWTAVGPPRVVGLKLSQIARQNERMKLPHREIQTKQIGNEGRE